MLQDRFHQHGATLPACCLLLLTILAYLPALDAGFIIDDSLYVTDDARMETVAGLGRIWTEIVGVLGWSHVGSAWGSKVHG